MSFRSEAEQLRGARRALNLQEDAERAEVLAHIARLRAEAEALIAASRPSIQGRLREVLDECQADHDEERQFGWSLDAKEPMP